ncbi:MAG: amidohydrolase family protein [Myxococcales bacterium]|nr:amidohydrolase family protein [Myxococcales bacterium]
MGWVDYWCNAFTPDRVPLWDASLAAQGVPLVLRSDPEDSFAEPEVMLARMRECGIDTLVLPTCDLPPHADVTDYETFAARLAESADLAARFPGCFAAAWSIDPGHGMQGVRRAAEVLARDWVVALHLHTHSFDRRFDDAELYPYYALASDAGVPVIMQAGTSGGLMPSACGQPIGIDRPALYFPEAVFVLSHTGWPWVEEACAMALKFPNVYLGSATQPPKRWSESLMRFARGGGRSKVLLGTGFPLAGHRHLLAQLDDLEISDELRKHWLDENPHRVFAKLPAA